MRIATAQKDFIFNYWKEKAISNQVYLFGSRVDDSKKGGDIDILVLSEKKLPHTELFKMKQSFFSKFGEQKLDVVNFEKTNQSAFKKWILSYAKLLTNE
jgi:predicted nucleotidyltransferase